MLLVLFDRFVRLFVLVDLVRAVVAVLGLQSLVFRTTILVPNFHLRKKMD